MESSLSLLGYAGYPCVFSPPIFFYEASAANVLCAIILQAYLEMVGIKAEIKSLTSADFNAQKAEGVYDLGGARVNLIWTASSSSTSTTA